MSKDKIGKWCYSASEEHWECEKTFETIQEALDAAKAQVIDGGELEHLEKGDDIYIGQIVKINLIFNDDVDDYIEKFIEANYDEVPEACDSHFDDFTDGISSNKDTIKYIEEKLKAIKDHILKNHPIDFYSIEQIESFTVEFIQFS